MNYCYCCLSKVSMHHHGRYDKFRHSCDSNDCHSSKYNLHHFQDCYSYNSSCYNLGNNCYNHSCSCYNRSYNCCSHSHSHNCCSHNHNCCSYNHSYCSYSYYEFCLCCEKYESYVYLYSSNYILVGNGYCSRIQPLVRYSQPKLE